MDPQIKELATSIKIEIDRASRVLLHCHPNPDQDSVGSALAMSHALRALGKTVTVIAGDSPKPNYLSALPGFADIKPVDFAGVRAEDFDLFIIVDSDSPARVSTRASVVFPPAWRLVVIDHHVTNQRFGHINLVAHASATAEILFYLFRQWGIEIGCDIAACLLAGIYGDTGGLKFAGTTAATVAAVHDLVKIYPDFHQLLFAIDNNLTPEQLRFDGLAFSQVKNYFSGRVAVSAVAQADLVQHDIQPEQVSFGVANRLKAVIGWDIGASLVEATLGSVKLSLRTRDPAKYDLSRVAVGGGGGGGPPPRRRRRRRTQNDFARSSKQIALGLGRHLSCTWRVLSLPLNLGLANLTKRGRSVV